MVTVKGTPAFHLLKCPSNWHFFLPFKMLFNDIIVIRWKEYLISGWGWSNDWPFGPFGNLLSTSSNTRIYGTKSFFPTVTNGAWHYIFLKTRIIYLMGNTYFWLTQVKFILTFHGLSTEQLSVFMYIFQFVVFDLSILFWALFRWQMV